MAQESGTEAMTDAEKLEYLGGQVHALIGFAAAVITANAEPKALARHLDFVGEISVARVTNSLVSDQYLAGLEDVQNRLKQAVETAVQQRANPKAGR